MKFVESPNCDCGESRETINHFLLDCKEHKDARIAMFETISSVWLEKKSSGCLNVSKELLLELNFSEKLNVEDDKKVKKALFSYLLSAKDL